MNTFEERLEKLEAINRKLREGCPLDEAVSLFEKGMNMAKGLEKDLSRVERKTEILLNEPELPEETPHLEQFPDISDETSDD